MRTTFEFFADPGHGWAKVPRTLIYDLGLQNDISQYSYQRDNYVYLEEDRDLDLFANAMKEQNNVEIKLTEHHANQDSKIRKYGKYFP